jgi:hypothetical protein
MAAGVHLGHLCIESKNTGLELLISSSARYTASEEDDIEELRTQLTANPLDDHKQHPWFESCGIISLRISLQIEAGLAAAGHDALIETFSTQLQTALVYPTGPP